MGGWMKQHPGNWRGGLTASAALLAMLSIAHAEQYTIAQKIACGADFTRLCFSSFPNGFEAMKRCMIEHKMELTPACRREAGIR
jgi:hypothetical protein